VPALRVASGHGHVVEVTEAFFLSQVMGMMTGRAHGAERVAHPARTYRVHGRQRSPHGQGRDETGPGKALDRQDMLRGVHLRDGLPRILRGRNRNEMILQSGFPEFAGDGPQPRRRFRMPGFQDVIRDNVRRRLGGGMGHR